jgi:ribosomal protein S3
VAQRKKMKAIIDLNQRTNVIVTGLRMQLSGRINGSSRSQKKVILYGRQQQQHIESVIEYAYERIETKFGTLGLKVQSTREPKTQISVRGLKMRIK